jgi:rubrerythrin
MPSKKKSSSVSKRAKDEVRAKAGAPRTPDRASPTSLASSEREGPLGKLGSLWGKKAGKMNQVDELLCQALETELGGVQVYRTALRCAQNDDLREEWQKYLEETERHVRLVSEVCESRGLDPETETLGRQIVRHKGQALVAAMEMALRCGPPEAAQLVAAECVVDAENKDHANWELIGKVVEKLEGGKPSALKAAYDEVEEDEDEHLYHTMGWARELWIQSLGLPAVLPPPEERRDVTDAISAAEAKKSRDEMVGVRG